MILTTEKREIEVGGVAAQRDFTIKAGAHIMQVLSGLYRDPIDAMVREYLTNMHDAYVALLRTQPNAHVINPVIHAPTSLSPYLEFRDFGIGMSMDTVWNVYSQYGNSTKNGSNDEVGGFGLGSKTAFCYNNGSTWNIESRFNNEMHVFAAFVGEDGIPQLTHVLSTPTDEHSGVTIRVPIRREDITKVHTAIKKYVPYFPMDVTITGEQLQIARPEVIIDGGQWRFVKNNGYTSLTLVMGNVPYVVNTRDDVYRNWEVSIGQLISYNTIELKVPVGAVDIVPSRDDLKYTDKTRAYIKSRIEAMVKELPVYFNDKIKNAANEWEALSQFKSYSDIRYIKNVVDSVTFNGTELSKVNGITRKLEDLTKLDASITLEQYKIESENRGAIVKSTPQEFSVNPFIITHVFINDLKRGGAGYVRGFMSQYVNKNYSGRTASYGHKVSTALVFNTKLSAKQLHDFLGGFPESSIIFTSTLEKDGVKTVKNAKKETIYKWSGSSWIARATIPDGNDVKYYLPLTNSNGTRRYAYGRGVDSVNALTCVYPSPNLGIVLYGIRSDEVKNFDTNVWKNFETVVTEYLIKFLRDNKKELVNYIENLGVHADKKLIEIIKALDLHTISDLAKQYLDFADVVIHKADTFESIKSNLYYLPKTVADIWNAAQSTSKTNCDTIKDRLLAKYPILDLVYNYFSRLYYDQYTKTICEKYRKLVLDNMK